MCRGMLANLQKKVGTRNAWSSEDRKKPFTKGCARRAQKRSSYTHCQTEVLQAYFFTELDVVWCVIRLQSRPRNNFPMPRTMQRSSQPAGFRWVRIAFAVVCRSRAVVCMWIDRVPAQLGFQAADYQLFLYQLFFRVFSGGCFSVRRLFARILLRRHVSVRCAVLR